MPWIHHPDNAHAAKAFNALVIHFNAILKKGTIIMNEDAAKFLALASEMKDGIARVIAKHSDVSATVEAENAELKSAMSLGVAAAMELVAELEAAAPKPVAPHVMVDDHPMHVMQQDHSMQAI